MHKKISLYIKNNLYPKLVIFLRYCLFIHIHKYIHDKSCIYYFNQLLAQQFIRCWILQINRQLSDVVSETDARAEDVMHDHLSKGIILSLYVVKQVCLCEKREKVFFPNGLYAAVDN